MRRFGILAVAACLLVLSAANISWAQSDPPAAPTITSITPGYQSLSVGWEIPSEVDAADITAFELRHIESDATDKTDDTNWNLTEDLTSIRTWGILGGLTIGTQYDVQARVVTDTDGTWSSHIHRNTRRARDQFRDCNRTHTQRRCGRASQLFERL